ncbi:MAG: GNAT family N-acetyltransferase [Hyphomicrobiaceae bacterium]|nr:GNAT family N-acetyltransferase [Hyphomicrobiaceae bacterium]
MATREGAVPPGLWNGGRLLSETRAWDGEIRKLWPRENDRFREHLLRLDKESRRLRFGHGVSDAFIDDYAGRTDLTGCLIYGFFSKGHLRAAAELRKLGDTWGREAEAAFSVERTFQDQGLGTELMGRVIRSARNRGVQLLYMSCLAENRKMQRIASKHEAVLRYELGEVVGEIVPNSANYASLMVEALEDRMAFMFAVLDLQKRIASSAA